MTRRATGTALMLSLLALTGCGSKGEGGQSGSASNGATAAAAGIDPCSFVSSEDVATAIGEKVVAAKAEGDICTYESEDPQASSVKVQVKPSGAAEEMKTVRAASNAMGQMGAQMQGQEGAQGDVGNALAAGGAASLGDESLFDPNQQLHVRKGDTYIAVAPPMLRSRMSGGNPLLSDEQKRGMASAIAQKMLAKVQ
jgi:hypothetical protein